MPDGRSVLPSSVTLVKLLGSTLAVASLAATAPSNTWMVAQFGNTKLTTYDPGSAQSLKDFTRHSRWQVHGAELVKNRDLPDAGGIDTCLVRNRAHQVPRPYAVDSANFDAESLELAR
jgi:hypothetical protein